MLAFLLTGTAYSEQLPNKPFKVCPEVVTAKDTPCRPLGPTASIVHRSKKSEPKSLTELEQENKQLKEAIKLLEEKLNEQDNRKLP